MVSSAKASTRETPVGPQARGALLLKKGARVEHFRIIRLIGQGGMGQVYLARDLRLGRKVAIKVIRPRSSGLTSDFVSMFVAEARATARFSHPHIIAIYEVGEYEGYPYFVLEYVNGPSLRKRSRNRHLGRQEIIRIGVAIASALDEAHGHGIIHLDLKPSNIILPKDGRLRVLDFGLARTVASAHPAPEEASRASAGTPAYMAPEQWRKEDLDGAADVWALGIILYELVHGARPYAPQEAGTNTLREAVTSDHPAPRLPSREPLSGLVAACLEKAPNRRPTAHEIKSQLQGLLLDPSAQDLEPENPFRGLRPFTAHQALSFFGREREIAELVERLAEEPVLPIVGASGAGKSSLIQAGLIPRLMEQEKWLVFSFRPGLDPFKSLAGCLTSSDPSTLGSGKHKVSQSGRADALAAQLFVFPENLTVHLEELAFESQSRVLVVVDQLEELYTLSDDVERQHRFIRALTAAADDAFDPVRILFTVRDDFLLRLAAAGPEVRAVMHRMMLLQAPERDALEETLVRPVRLLGYTYEDTGMVQEMIDAVEAKPSSLPLLQFAAYMLWERRDRTKKQITRHAFQELGGVAGVLARHADGVLDGVVQIDLVREILLRLVTSENTRRVVLREELLDGLGDSAAAVLDALIAARLVTTVRLSTPEGGRPAVELAHESLIQSWSRLRGWIDNQKDELRFLAEAREAAELWIKRGRPPEEVWTRGTLQNAQRLLDDCVSSVPETVRAFIEAGKTFERRRRLRARGWITAVFLSLLIVLSIALRGWNLAETNHAKAVKSIIETRNAIHLVSATLRRSDPTLALALLREMDPSGPLPSNWRDLVYQSTFQPIAQVVLNHPGPVYGVAMNSDGTQIVTACADSKVRLHAADGTKAPLVLTGYERRATTVAFSPNGRRIVSAAKDGTARVLNSDGSGTVIDLRGHEDAIHWATFGPTGRWVGTAAKDKTARLWDLEAPHRPIVLRGHTASLETIAFSPDGRHVATAALDQTVRIWKRDGSNAPTVIPFARGSSSVAFTPDGRHILAGGSDGIIQMWTVEGSTTARVFKGHEGNVTTISISLDGTRMVSGSMDRTARVWRMADAKPLLILRHSSNVSSASFSANADQVVTGAADNTARVWNIEDARLPMRFRGHRLEICTGSYSPDGTQLVTSSLDGTVRIWNANDPNDFTVHRPHQVPVYTASFSPDGQRIVSGAEDGTLRVWRADGTGEPVDLPGHEKAIYLAIFNPDGQRVASGSYDGTVRIWHLDGSRPPLVFRDHKATVNGVSFSPDGTRIASGSNDKTAHVRNTDGSGELLVLQGHNARVRAVAFSPDGSRLLTGDQIGKIRIWQIDRRDPQGQVPFVELKGGVGRIWSGGAGSGAFHPNGALALTVSEDGLLHVWHTEGSHEAVTWSFPKASATYPNIATFSPDGTHILTGWHNGRDAETGQMDHWITAWPFQNFKSPRDPALWRLTQYCMPVELRMELLRMSREEAELERARCQKRVAETFERAGVDPTAQRLKKADTVAVKPL